MKRKNTTLFLTRGALIGALYVILSYVSAPLQFAGFQFRIAEALCILPIFLFEAIPGLTIGCLVANHITGAVIWDTVFGALATLIGAVGAYYLRKLPERFKWICTLPTVFANAIIVPLVIIYAYSSDGSYLFFAFTVFIGEAVTASILGSLLYYNLKKMRFFDTLKL